MHSCERDYYELVKKTLKKKIISKRDLSTWVYAFRSAFENILKQITFRYNI